MHGNDESVQAIAFQIDQQDFCLDIIRVKEIRGWTPITPLPGATQMILGMMNLRGTVIPAIDLAYRLGYEPVERCSRPAILVVEVVAQTVGLLVEAVSDIIRVDKSNIQNAPADANCTDRLVTGVTTKGDTIITILNVEGIVDVTTLGEVTRSLAELRIKNSHCDLAA